jgi:hypothetical protein
MRWRLIGCHNWVLEYITPEYIVVGNIYQGPDKEWFWRVRWDRENVMTGCCSHRDAAMNAVEIALAQRAAR